MVVPVGERRHSGVRVVPQLLRAMCQLCPAITVLLFVHTCTPDRLLENRGTDVAGPENHQVRACEAQPACPRSLPDGCLLMREHLW